MAQAFMNSRGETPHLFCRKCSRHGFLPDDWLAVMSLGKGLFGGLLSFRLK